MKKTTHWSEKLVDLGACPEAVKWARGVATPECAWETCPRGDWLLWVAMKLGVDRRLLVRAACACARTSLEFAPTGEDRPRIAIETAEAWSRGEATSAQVLAAARAAAYAAYAAYAANAAAAYVAADADADADAAYAAYADADAAYAAYAAAYAAAAADARAAATAAAAAARAADAAYAAAADVARDVYVAAAAAVDAAAAHVAYARTDVRALHARLVREIVGLPAFTP